MSHSGQTGAEAETGGKVRGITPVKAALGVVPVPIAATRQPRVSFS